MPAKVIALTITAPDRARIRIARRAMTWRFGRQVTEEDVLRVSLAIAADIWRGKASTKEQAAGRYEEIMRTAERLVAREPEGAAIGGTASSP